MRVLSDKLEKEVEDVTRDVEAYEACVQRLEGETQDVLSEAEFLKEKKKVIFSFSIFCLLEYELFMMLSDKLVVVSCSA